MNRRGFLAALMAAPIAKILPASVVTWAAPKPPAGDVLYTTFTELVMSTYRANRKEVLSVLEQHNELYRSLDK